MSNQLIDLRRKFKDSLFIDIFHDPQYCLELYRYLHPEDNKANADNIRIVTLKTVLVDHQYNDLGFMVDDRLVVLAEAQSTWSENILVRALLYLADTYKEFFNRQEKNLYSSRKISLPKPEIVVVYTGEQTVSEKISLADSFFGGDGSVLDLRVKVLSKPTKEHIAGQFITAAQRLTELSQRGPVTEEVILNVIGMLIEEGVLSRYLRKQKHEVISMLKMLFNQETVFKRALKEEREVGHAEGRAEVLSNMVVSMYLAHDSIERIAQIAKMTPEEIKQILIEHHIL